MEHLKEEEVEVEEDIVITNIDRKAAKDVLTQTKNAIDTERGVEEGMKVEIKGTDRVLRAMMRGITIEIKNFKGCLSVQR